MMYEPDLDDPDYKLPSYKRVWVHAVGLFAVIMLVAWIFY
jgi:hypothetical protein